MFRLWAKTAIDGRQWHALPFHLLDVAATAEQLWRRLGTPTRRLIETFIGGDPDQAQLLCVFLAASHDAGKANRYFQGKVDFLAETLTDLGVVRGVPEPAKHGQATNAYLAKWLKDRWNWDTTVYGPIASAVGGHHGAYFGDDRLSHLRLNEEPWCDIGNAVLDNLAVTLGIDVPIPPPANVSALVAWLSGFTTIADWLGSHEQMTVFETQPRNLAEYYQEAQVRAQALLDELGYFAPFEGEPLALGGILPPGRKPNEMQLLAEHIGQNDFSLAIVEAPTGEGKTEAAFTLADPSRAAGAGLYFALPTMATANGLFPRVQTYLDVALENKDNSARLLHSLAWLNRDSFNSIDNPGNDTTLGTADDWFASGKRGLLTPYGVGTIDQALVGAIQVKHFFVRLFALAGKTVVVDEVHAYDLYMSTLMSVLLSWLKVLGCRVILLSATLPAARRAELLSKWGTEASVTASYPCITWVGIDGSAHSESFEVVPRKALSIRFTESNGEELEELGVKTILTEVAQKPGFGALIFNTVARAQRAYKLLKSKVKPSEVDVVLFHARFTAEDRQLIESKVLSRFGKDGQRGRSAIVVATQVIEQSLDLDFDHLVSELAPIDLLIQRAGRLHRHRRSIDGVLRPSDEADERPSPTLIVLPPTYGQDELPEFESNVYDADILMKTEDLIRNDLVIRCSMDISKSIEFVYGEGEADTRPGAEERLAKYREMAQKRATRKCKLAEDVAITDPKNPYTVALYKNRFEEDDDQPKNDLMAKTRLEDLPTVSIVISTESRPAPQGTLNTAAKREIALRTVKTNANGKRLAGLLSLPHGDGWDKHKSFRHCLLAELGPGNTFNTDGYQYAYNDEIGLTWEKLDA